MCVLVYTSPARKHLPSFGWIDVRRYDYSGSCVDGRFVWWLFGGCAKGHPIMAGIWRRRSSDLLFLGNNRSRVCVVSAALSVI
jgi:hypothetical protein